MSARIHALLAQHLGLEVSSIGVAAVRAAIADRARACGVTADEYGAALAGDREELGALVDAIVVPESWFFRDRVPFQYLAQQASKVFRKRRHVRVLSAPCSTGEEPYSVAMALVDAGLGANVSTIDAIDVSPRLLAIAREGVYRANSFRGIDERYRSEYFVPSDGTWTLSEDIRRMVRFRHANLMAPDFLAREAPYDIILCRNLLIYLTTDARRTALQRLSSLLVEGGTLFVGHAEALEVIDPRFKSTGVSGGFAYTLRGDEDKSAPVVARATAKVAPRVLERRADKTQPLDPEEIEAAAPPPDRLLAATALADRGDLAAASALVERHLAITGADAKGWALLGAIRQASGDSARAEECFSRAVYCDPQHYTALVQLALLLEKRGETKGAAHLRARAERAKGVR